MAEKPQQGKILGIPYNFDRPSIGRMLSAYWQPGEGMLVEKPFGIGYTLNLASWRSWVVLVTAGVMLWSEQTTDSEDSEDVADDSEDEPVDVIVD
jgi:hypothetical protein